jgi:hypothetical protein
VLILVCRLDLTDAGNKTHLRRERLLSDPCSQHLLLSHGESESRRLARERRAAPALLPAERHPVVVGGLSDPVSAWRCCGIVFDFPQHVRDSVVAAAARRFVVCIVVERLAHQFQQVVARLDWSGAACWRAEE